MKKEFLIIFAIFHFATLKAQHNEIGLFLGTSYYLGDLNPSRQFSLIKPAGGLIYRYSFDQRWAIKLSGLYGTVAGDDAKTKFNETRNLSFKSPIYEVSSQLELNFLPYATGNLNKDYFTPYIFGGVSFFGFNPKAKYNGSWYNLQPLGTEGQGTVLTGTKQYSLLNVSFPFGLGFKYSVGKNLCIGAEWGLRKTITDYIDDVSTTYANPDALNSPMSVILADRSGTGNNTGLQRGNSGTKDWYSFAGAFITFSFKKDQGTCSSFK